MTKPNNEPAFPQPYTDHVGMTLLDYFAGQALAGLYTQSTYSTHYGPKITAVDAYDFAEAMLQEKAHRESEAPKAEPKSEPTEEEIQAEMRRLLTVVEQIHDSPGVPMEEHTSQFKKSYHALAIDSLTRTK